MADNKSYYYIKLKDNYFEQDNIKVLESLENGYIYSLIIIKLYLKSAKSEGRLMMTTSIPYSPERVEILARVISHDVAHVKEAIKLGVELDLITIIDSDEIWLNDIQNFIGKASTEADRKRLYRKKLNKKQLLGQMSGQIPDKTPPEIEIEIEKELELKKDIKYIYEKFQEICTSLPKPKKLTDTRKKAIKARLKEYDKETILEVFNKVEKSNFLSGRNGQWQASFDWIMKPSNFVKILEDNYKNKLIQPFKNTCDYQGEITEEELKQYDL